MSIPSLYSPPRNQIITVKYKLQKVDFFLHWRLAVEGQVNILG